MLEYTATLLSLRLETRKRKIKEYDAFVPLIDSGISCYVQVGDGPIHELLRPIRPKEIAASNTRIAAHTTKSDILCPKQSDTADCLSAMISH